MGNTLAHTQSVVLSEEVAITGPVLCLRSGEHVQVTYNTSLSRQSQAPTNAALRGCATLSAALKIAEAGD